MTLSCLLPHCRPHSTRTAVGSQVLDGRLLPELLGKHQRVCLNGGIVLICHNILHYISKWIRGAEINTTAVLHGAQVDLWDLENTSFAVRLFGHRSLCRCTIKMTFPCISLIFNVINFRCTPILRLYIVEITSTVLQCQEVLCIPKNQHLGNTIKHCG